MVLHLRMEFPLFHSKFSTSSDHKTSKPLCAFAASLLRCWRSKHFADRIDVPLSGLMVLLPSRRASPFWIFQTKSLVSIFKKMFNMFVTVSAGCNRSADLLNSTELHSRCSNLTASKARPLVIIKYNKYRFRAALPPRSLRWWKHLPLPLSTNTIPKHQNRSTNCTVMAIYWKLRKH